MGDENVGVQIDPLHFFLAPKRTAFFTFTVLSALKETVLPDFVLNLTFVGFATVLVATRWTFLVPIR